MLRLDAVPAVALAAALLAGCHSRPCCPPPAREARTPALATAAKSAEIFIDTTIVKVSEGAVPAALPGFQLGAQPVRVLSASEADGLQATWASTKGVQVVAMPKILTADRQDATMSAGETTTWPGAAGEQPLKFDVDKFLGTSAGWSGFAMRITPTISPDGRSVLLDLHAGMREVRKPPAGAAPSDGAPQTDGVEAAGKVTLPGEGGAALLTAPAALSVPAGRFVFAVLVRARVREQAP